MGILPKVNFLPLVRLKGITLITGYSCRIGKFCQIGKLRLNRRERDVDLLGQRITQSLDLGGCRLSRHVVWRLHHVIVDFRRWTVWLIPHSSWRATGQGDLPDCDKIHNPVVRN
ncbi:MAG: hypothetical protein SFX18_04910 [Pirellulales bacterium]|nr:hypothetical protein [Pirellulales bacterium]